MDEKTSSLSREVDLVLSAVRAARFGIERLCDVPVRDSGLPVGLPWAIRAALIFVEVRLRDLDRVVRGTHDPDHHWHEETSDHGIPDPEHRDVCFRWTSKRRLGHLQRELDRAERRRRHEQRRTNGR